MSTETKETKKILIHNTTERIIVIGGPGVLGMKEGHGTMLAPGYSEVDFDLWEACRAMLAHHIENNVLIPSETLSKGAKGEVTYESKALKDLDPKAQAKAIADCNDVKQLEEWKYAEGLKESVRIECGKRIDTINNYKG